jgi:hypothetical protein
MTTERHEITWHGIRIEITYRPDTSPAFRKSYGRPLDHLEVRSLAPERVSRCRSLTPAISRSFMPGTSLRRPEAPPPWFWPGWIISPNPRSGKPGQITRQQLDLFS